MVQLVAAFNHNISAVIRFYGEREKLVRTGSSHFRILVLSRLDGWMDGVVVILYWTYICPLTEMLCIVVCRVVVVPRAHTPEG